MDTVRSIIPNVPLFPEMKRLSITDRVWFTTYMNQYEPYSDFNFVSLYSYDTEEDAELSRIGSNLIIKFRDYMTNEPFYTFIGTHEVEHTIQLLLRAAEDRNYLPKLQLIPQVVIDTLGSSPKDMHVTEDADNADYVLSIPEIATLQGSRFANKRHMTNKFNRNVPEAVIKPIDLGSLTSRQEIITVFHLWEETKEVHKTESEHEFLAILRLLEVSDVLSLVGIGVYIQGAMRGFAIAEVLSDGYSLFHFVKGDTTISGISEILYQFIARELALQGCVYFNIEQNLGIPGLKVSKDQWNPVSFLKKYTIS